MRSWGSNRFCAAIVKLHVKVKYVGLSISDSNSAYSGIFSGIIDLYIVTK